MQMKVRLKPTDRAAGMVMKDYAAPWGQKYKAGIWYDMDSVDAAVHLDYLRRVRQEWHDHRTPLAFNVCTPREAQQVMAEEERRALGLTVTETEQAFEGPDPRIMEKPKVKPARELNQPRPQHELTQAALQEMQAEADAESEVIEPEPDPDPEPAPRAPSRKPPPAKPKAKPAAKKKAPPKKKATPRRRKK